jgi:hypothetical protein
MKKYPVLFALFFICGLTVWPQEQKYTVEEAVRLLESDFAKYPWVHLYYSRKIHDASAAATKVMRQTYENGEIVTMNITRGGWRYEVKLNFASEKQAFAKRAHDVKTAVYQSINEILPEKSAGEE